MALLRSTRQLPESRVAQRELFGFALYRVLEAVLLASFAFAPEALDERFVADALLLDAAAAAYLLLALLLLYDSRRGGDIETRAGLGLGLDISIAAAVMAALTSLDAVIGVLLLFNLVIGSLLLSLRLALVLALLAVAMVFIEYLFGHYAGTTEALGLFEPGALAAGYLVGMGFSQYLRHELARSQALAEERGSALARMAELNELVLRRLRTGVLVVDAEHRLLLFNEAAWALLGARGDTRRLAELSPALEARLRQWRADPGAPPEPLLGDGDGPALQARFARVLHGSPLFLVFLDDPRAWSEQAEALTLATLGRLGASIAHEIRNPLAAIHHAAQLLEESPTLEAAEQRLLAIILGQSRRMDAIVESVLGLARRDCAQPESLLLAEAVRRFLEEHEAIRPLHGDGIETMIDPTLEVMADPRHLHQVLSVLVENARNYGRQPGQPARIELRARLVEDGVTEAVEIELLDHGPGIAPEVAARLFEPFFTTSEQGTGLGLYLARQLCEANQGSLHFVPMAATGACFRLRLPGWGGTD